MLRQSLIHESFLQLLQLQLLVFSLQGPLMFDVQAEQDANTTRLSAPN